jgi:hypothetical protein
LSFDEWEKKVEQVRADFRSKIPKKCIECGAGIKLCEQVYIPSPSAGFPSAGFLFTYICEECGKPTQKFIELPPEYTKLLEDLRELF